VSRALFWIFVIPLFLVVIVFAVSNNTLIDLSLWPALTETVPFPLYGVALASLFIGFLLGGIVSWIQSGRTRSRLREANRRASSDQQEIATLRSRLARLEATEQQASIPVLPAASVPAPAPAIAAETPTRP